MKSEDLPAISEQHLKFCEEFLQRRVAVHAALKAGLSEDYASAAVLGSRLLKTVQIKAWLAYLKMQQAKSLSITVPMLLREYAIIALSNIEEFQLDPKTGRLKIARGLPKALERSVKRRKITKKEQRRGQGDQITVTVEYTAEIELYDKLHALDQLLKYFKDLPSAGAGQGLSNADVLNILAGYLADVEEEPSEVDRRATPGAGGGVHPETEVAGPG